MLLCPGRSAPRRRPPLYLDRVGPGEAGDDQHDSVTPEIALQRLEVRTAEQR